MLSKLADFLHSEFVDIVNSNQKEESPPCALESHSEIPPYLPSEHVALGSRYYKKLGYLLRAVRALGYLGAPLLEIEKN